MSHAFLVALLPGNTEPDEVEEKLAALMASYDENMQIDPPRTVPCYCVGREAKERASAAAVKAYGTIASIREKFAAANPGDFLNDPEEKREREDALWRKNYIGPYLAVEKEALERDPDKAKPVAGCEECGGTGEKLSTYNPHSKWDWYVIGGRWDGELRGEARDDKDHGFNFGDEHHQLKYNMLPVSELRPAADLKPFAVLTPGGVWYEKGKMGWFGMTSDEVSKATWDESAQAIFDAFKDCLAIGVDFHI